MSEESHSLLKRTWYQFSTTWPLYVATVITTVFGFWVYGIASETVKTPTGQLITRWAQFRTGEPNTMGDTLAGFIGSLTLIWVIASVIQQSMELKAQRKEFAEMVRAQGAQVQALNAQAVLIEDEKKHRLEDRVADLFESQLEDLVYEIDFELKITGDWEVRLPSGEGETIYLFHMSEPYVEGGSVDTRLRNFSAALYMNILKLRAAVESGQVIALCGKRKYFEFVAGKILDIEKLSDELSRRQKFRIESLGLLLIRRRLESLVTDDVFWDDTRST